MKTANILVGILGFGLAGVHALAADSKPLPSGVPAVVTPGVPDTNAPSANATNAPAQRAPKGHAGNPPGVGHVLPPAANGNPPGSPGLSADVKSLAQQFNADRTAYLLQQQKLLGQLRQAGTTDRAAIRDQLRDLRDKWLDEQKQLSEEIRDRIQEIKTELKNQRDEQINDANNGGDKHHPKP